MIVRLALAALLCVVCSSAYAGPRHHHYRVQPSNHVDLGIPTSGCSDPVMRPCYRQVRASVDQVSRRLGQVRPRTPSPGLARVMAEGAGRAINWHRPRAWCGWWLGRHLGMLDRKLWLAANWARIGKPAHGPAVGAVVVWRHHVGIITGRSAHGWIVKSGNDGHRVRERPRSVAGAIAFRWPGA